MYTELSNTYTCTIHKLAAWERPITVRDRNVSLNYAQLAINDVHCMPATLYVVHCTILVVTSVRK